MKEIDQKGQISIEFVLILALMLVLVLIFVPYIGEQNELNTISLAAREGAMNTASDLVLNGTVNPLRVKDIILENEKSQNVTIQIDLSGSPSQNQTESIINGTLNSIAAQGYTRNDGDMSNSSEDDFIVTSRHRYNVTIVSS
ncbi:MULTISPECIES: TadE family protein [Methanobacterium]|uniref:Class III signal peptide-containing protein n=1 Tax=Methanobacterium bryantii TaxID=2161 RepID=A0A2A2H811_METBR|nr:MULTISPECIES: class III signal peptide-containing protein [Methanobacterium]OEC84881.1 hypothetical protein A9507_14570 [Methanobacterium sp. A39]PAV05527.1 hypothetical protein ASJ80_09125 [Methanobacterium bryantii]